MSQGTYKHCGRQYGVLINKTFSWAVYRDVAVQYHEYHSQILTKVDRITKQAHFLQLL